MMMMNQVVQPHFRSALRRAEHQFAFTWRCKPAHLHNDHHRHLIPGGTSSRYWRMMSSTSIDSSPSPKSSICSYSELAIHSPPRRAIDESTYRTVYIHPLSQIILEYLQNSRHDWVVDRGWDRSLTVHRDGSFELKFIQQVVDQYDDEAVEGEVDAIVEPTIGTDENDTPTVCITDLIPSSSNVESSAAGDGVTVPPDATVAAVLGRIWTSYDDEEKKHWLTVEKGPTVHRRFLLQDNLLPAWNRNRRGLPERIHLAVDEMIRTIDRSEVDDGTNDRPNGR